MRNPHNYYRLGLEFGRLLRGIAVALYLMARASIGEFAARLLTLKFRRCDTSGRLGNAAAPDILRRGWGTKGDPSATVIRAASSDKPSRHVGYSAARFSPMAETRPPSKRSRLRTFLIAPVAKP